MSARVLRALAVLATLAWASAATAQAPQPTAPPSADEGATLPVPPPEATPDLIKSIIEQEIQPAPGAYTYVPANRRDPFISLIKPIESGGRGQTKKPGMEGFLIQEVTLRGIVRTPQGLTAMFQGGDGKSYFVKAGQRLFDGAIVAVEPAGVTFRQDVTDPLSPVKSRTFRKNLNNETEEARQ